MPMNFSRIIFVGLNAVRLLSIVGLLLVFASSIEVMVTNIKAVNAFQADRIANGTSPMLDCDYIEGSTVPNQAAGVFWSVVASLLIIFQVVILLLSEFRWPSSFFDRFFPVLGNDFGLGALGIFQCLIGAQILSHHVDDFTLVSAFFLFSIGCLNIFLGLIFRESAKSRRSLRAKRQQDRGIITGDMGSFAPQFVPVYPTTMMEKPVQETASLGSFKSTAKSNMGFGRQGEKAAAIRGFMLQRPEESLPRYASPSPSFNNNAHEEKASPRPSRVPSQQSRSARSAGSSRSSSHSSRSSRSSYASEVETSSSFASPMSYRDTIQIPDSPRPGEEDAHTMPVPFHAQAPLPKYGRVHGKF